METEPRWFRRLFGLDRGARLSSSERTDLLAGRQSKHYAAKQGARVKAKAKRRAARKAARAHKQYMRRRDA